ncbi:MAG: FliM/FliN family flagellar motor switch protein [Planctomycetota bacterium]
MAETETDSEPNVAENPENEAVDTETTSGEADANESEDGDSIPEFEQLSPNPPKASKEIELSRFGGVHVTLTAVLGKTELTIGELIGLAEGSVVELNRPISAPVELVAQGVPMGNGEVVVIEDQFAIRIKQIYPS